jgi:hypothetical protein
MIPRPQPSARILQTAGWRNAHDPCESARALREWACGANAFTRRIKTVGALVRIKRLAAIVCCAALGLAAHAQAPRITQIESTPAGLILRWTPTDPHDAYSIQERDALEGGLWTLPRAAHPWPIDATQWSDPAGANRPTRFFRLLAVPRAERGRVLEARPLDMLSLAQVNFLFTRAQIPITPQHAVLSYRIRYETIDPWGGRAIASGVLILPQGVGPALPLVSYQHGTLIETNDAPSAKLEQRLPGIGLASLGYAATVPDLLGFGDSPGLHPYHHARSQASAAIDLLRAARTWSGTHALALDGQLFLLGYSQGGHATMALHRDLQTYHSDEFTVTASAPMAGAYDLSGVTRDDFLSGRAQPNAYYFAYLLAAYWEVYQFTNSLADLLVAPYDTTLPPLLERRASGAEINAAMPADPAQVLKPEILDAVRQQPNHPILLALRDNDVLDWVPESPVRLYHCRGDQDVVFANSEVALARFHAAGATQVTLVEPLPDGTHTGCAQPAFLLVKDWFETFRH